MMLRIVGERLVEEEFCEGGYNIEGVRKWLSLCG